MKSIKTVSKKSSSKQINLQGSTSGAPHIEPVPAVGAPAPPKDFVPSRLARLGGPRASGIVIKAAPGASEEIRSSVRLATYVADFGHHAPDGDTIADALALAAAWSRKVREAESWAAYVKAQSAAAWSAALGCSKALKPGFDYAVLRDPTVKERYPATAQLFEAPSLAGKRAAAIRKAKKQIAKKDKPPATNGDAAVAPTVPQLH